MHVAIRHHMILEIGCYYVSVCYASDFLIVLALHLSISLQ